MAQSVKCVLCEPETLIGIPSPRAEAGRSGAHPILQRWGEEREISELIRRPAQLDL